jgi:mRNA interferase RelE/StbE
VSRYTVYVTPTVWEELKDLPGHMRQRVRRAITALADDPSPATSKALTSPGQPRETSASEDDTVLCAAPYVAFQP